MRKRTSILLVTLVALTPLIIGATYTSPYWFPELHIGGGYINGGTSIDSEGNIYAAGTITGSVETEIESLPTSGASGTVAVSQGDGTVAMEDVYQPGETIPDADIAEDITVGATGSVHADALPGTVIFEADVYAGATVEDAGVRGLVPDSAAGSLDRFLCVDGTFKVPGIGAVTGPGSSIDNAIARWDGTNGDTIQNSLVTIDDSGNLTLPGTVTVGSSSLVWSNAQGLIDGGMLQDHSVTSSRMSLTGVTTGTYTFPVITIDGAGRITAASEGTVDSTDLDDGPGAYGSPGYVAVVNAGQNGWTWEDVLDPEVLPVMVGDSGSGGVQGVVPAPQAGDVAAGKFLFADGSWATPVGTGNVSGPGTSTDHAVALFDGTGGQTLQDSGITSPDGQSITIPGTITAGSGAHQLTNSLGLLDGGKLQDDSVTGAKIDHLGFGALTDPDADRIAFWDDSAGVLTWLTLGTNLSITGTTLNAVGGGGTAGPDALVVFNPADGEPPASAYATLDTRNAHPVLDFDPDTDESMYFTGVMPQRYTGNGVYVYIYFAMTTATSDTVKWAVAFENLGGGVQDLDTDGFATAQTVTSSLPATSGVVSHTTFVSFSDGAQMDSVDANDPFRLHLMRDADDATYDTASGDAEVVIVYIYEQGS